MDLSRILNGKGSKMTYPGKMRKGLTAPAALFAFIALVFGADRALAENCCVGYLNLEAVIAQSTIGHASGAQFQKEVDARGVEVQKRLDEVKKLKVFLETRGDMLNDVELKDKYAEYDRAVAAYQNEIQAAEKEMKERDKAIMRAILEKIDPIVQEIAVERGFMVIVKDPSMLGYVHPSVDISKEVLKRLEAQTAAEAAASGKDAGGKKAKPQSGAQKPAATH